MNNPFQDTIIAPATIPGTGAISIIRISGPEAFSIVDATVQIKGGKCSLFKGFTIHYGLIYGSDGAFLDEVLVSIFRAPHSYTGEDSIEISCHASSYIVSEILSLLTTAGARMAKPGEFTERAFLNGKMDLTQAEAVADVISSNTSAFHRIASNQLRGGFSSELSLLRSQLLEMASLLELELDFSEEDVEFADRKKLLTLLSTCSEHVERLRKSFKMGNAIKNGVPVALVGPVNAGKSTLLNSLLGEERAIVSDIAGTTRDTIEEVLNIDGILFRFIDTAGLRETQEAVEKIGIKRTYQKISEAEIVILVLDGASSENDILDNLKGVAEFMKFDSQDLIICLNKCDLYSQSPINKNVSIINNLVSCSGYKADIINISAKDKTGLDLLYGCLISRFKDVKLNEDSTFITNQRHFDSLSRASEALEKVRISLSTSLPTDLVADDLRLAISIIGEITGEITSPEILENIFSKHCIGK